VSDTEHENGDENGETPNETWPSGADLPPEEVQDLVVACTEFVQRATGLQLDFTPETLPLLDHYITASREELQGRPELELLVTRAAGAYFGEIVRHALGGFWMVPSGNVIDWLVCGRRVFLSFNPVGVAYDALYQSSEHAGPASRLRLAPDEKETVERRLADLPEVSEEEFYLFSTRFEVLEIAADALLQRLHAAGYGDTEFEPTDYLHEMRPLGEA
jgi:hypothetical protein